MKLNNDLFHVRIPFSKSACSNFRLSIYRVNNCRIYPLNPVTCLKLDIHGLFELGTTRSRDHLTTILTQNKTFTLVLYNNLKQQEINVFSSVIYHV